MSYAGFGSGGRASEVGGSENAVVEDNVEFGGASFNGGSGFFELGVRVLGSFVKAYNASDENVSAF
jgi:hypothetical protein